MANYKILGSSSAGNAIIYFDEILVDVGLNYSTLAPHLKNIKMILLTHAHGDHFKLPAINLIARERPDIIWITPPYLLSALSLLNIKNIFVIEVNKKYKIGNYKIEAFELFHDIANIGYKITNKNGYKLIHATDTVKIDHIEARDFDLYAIEHNYDEADIHQRIKDKVNAGIFAYEVRTLDSHLSFQKAQDWIKDQKNEKSEIIKLHISSYYREEEKNGSGS